MRHQGVIFDLDGVICSTDEFHYQAWSAICEKQGIPFDRTVNKRLLGLSRMDSLEVILEKADRSYARQEKEDLASEKNGLYRGFLQQMGPDDASHALPQLLASLKEHGVKVAIGSSSRNTRTILGRPEITDEFDAIVDGTMISHAKPDPRGLPQGGRAARTRSRELPRRGGRDLGRGGGARRRLCLRGGRRGRQEPACGIPHGEHRRGGGHRLRGVTGHRPGRVVRDRRPSPRMRRRGRPDAVAAF